MGKTEGEKVGRLEGGKGDGMAGISTKAGKIKEKACVNFNFPADDNVAPKNFTAAQINETVTVVVKGRVSHTAANTSDWDKGVRFSLEMTSCEILPKQKKVSIEDAVNAAQKTYPGKASK